jgi:hypothetical protein
MGEIKRRERDAVIQSLQTGQVPRMGLHLIQVGRKLEVSALLKDLERIEEGGAAFRIVVGRFGSGKSFFLNLIRFFALQKRMVVLQADISMERRLHATGGESRALYSELVNNLATKTKPEGGALRNVCEGWISSIKYAVTSAGGDEAAVKRRIYEDLRSLQDHVGGFELAQALEKYYEGHLAGNDTLQGCALRWLRGEYTTKTEARQDLGVRRIIDDESFYDSLKLLAAFVVKAGYAGLLVNLDELVVLSHRLPSSRARESNYEAILTILNDCFQGSVANLGFLMAGTDDFLEDKRRGLYSHDALRSRLMENRFATEGIVDFSGPLLRLQNLTPEDLFVLLQRIRDVYAFGDPAKYTLPDEALLAVLKKASENLGADYFKTPRELIRSFVGLLNVLEQNPGKRWTDFLDGAIVKTATAPSSVEEQLAAGAPPTPDTEDLTAFKL